MLRDKGNGTGQRKGSVGVSTWKLVLILLAVVVVAGLGAYEIQAVRSQENRAQVDYGFKLGAGVVMSPESFPV